MRFAQRLDELLIERGISAYQISKATGISDRLIGYWRKGEKKPTLDNVAKLSEYLGVSVDWLLGGDEAVPMNNQIGDVSGGTFVQGVNKGTLIGADGGHTPLSPEAKELLRIFEGLDVRRRMELLQKGFSLETENKEGRK